MYGWRSRSSWSLLAVVLTGVIAGGLDFAHADVELNVVANPDPAAPGEQIRVQITVANNGASSESDLIVSMDYPAGMNFVAESLITGPFTFNCTSASCTSGETMVWDVGILAPGQSLTFSFPAVVANATLAGTEINWLAAVSNAGGELATSLSVITVDPEPALSVSIDERDDPVVADGDLSFTIRYGNRSAASVTSTQLRFPMPAQTMFVSASQRGILADGEVSWDLGTLAAGAVGERTVVVQVDGPPSSGSLIASEAIIEAISSALPTRRRSSEVTRVAPNTPLALSLSVFPQSAQPGETTIVEMTVTNTDDAQVFGGRIDLSYPAGMNFVAESLINGPFTFGCSSASCIAGEVVVWELETMNPGQSLTFWFPAAVANATPSGSAIPWRAKISDDSGAESEESTTTTVREDPALTLALCEDADPIAAGDDLTVTMRYGNSAASSVSSVALSFPVPSGTTFVSATGDASVSDGVVSWSLGTLDAGGVGEQRVVLSVNENLTPGTLVESEAAIGGTRNALPTERRATTATVVAPTRGLEVSLNVTPQPAQPGEQLDVEITVANSAASPVFGARVELRYPPGQNFVAENLVTGPFTFNCSSASCVSGENAVWDLGTLSAGQSMTFSMPSVVAQATPAGSVIPWQVLALDDSGAVTAESKVTTVDATPELSITIDESRDPVPAGEELTYSVIYGNASDISVTGAVLSFALPTESTFTSASGDGEFADGSVRWSLGTLGAGTVGEESVVVSVAGGLPNGTLLDSEAAIEGTAGSLPTQRRATAATYVAPDTPLGLTLDVVPSSLLPGESVDVRLAVTNTSAAQVFGARVDMRHPTGLNFVNEAAITGPFTNNCTSASCISGENMIWDLGVLDPGATVLLGVPSTVANLTPRGSVISWKAMASEDSGSVVHRSTSGGITETDVSVFLRGDCNDDGSVDISDGIFNLNALFVQGSEQSNCLEACNANNDDSNDISDAIFLFNFLFVDGEPIEPPYPGCGEDPQPDDSIGCDRTACLDV